MRPSSRSSLAALWLLCSGAVQAFQQASYVNRHHRNINPFLPRTTTATPWHAPSKLTTPFSLGPLHESTTAPSSEGNSNTGGGTASIPNEVFNLVKGIVGAGVLSLPAGMAKMGNAPGTVVPAVALIATIGALSGYGFALIGRVCALTDTTSYRGAWEASVSQKSSWIPAVSVTLKTVAATLAYSMILAETFQALAVSVGFAQVSQTMVLLALTTTVLLPLCLLKNLSSLAPFSLVGTMGMIYTGTAMTIRYLGKAYQPKVGKFAKDVVAPSFGASSGSLLNPATTILLGMLSTSYMAHFNAPKFYTELKNNTIPRYLKVVSTSFFISVALFAWISTIGFLTFGASSSGLILANYSTKDTLMSVSRLAVAISLVFSYPLAFVGARDGFVDLFKLNKDSMKTSNTVTVGLLSAVTLLALVIPDVSFVLAFAGATLGNCLIYIFPGLMFRGAIRKLKNPTKTQKREVGVALTSAVIGAGLGVMGAIKAVQSIL